MRKRPCKLGGIAAIAGMLISCGSPEQKEAKHLQRGKQYFTENDYASAVAEFRSAAQDMPSDAEPYYQQALVHMAAGDFRLAVGSLLHAVELNSKHGQAQLKLAELMTTSTVTRDVREARGKIQDFLSSQPDDMEAISALAAADWKLGLAEEAEDHLKKALEKFPQNLRARALLAKIHVLNNDLPGAETVLKQAVDITPGSIPVLMGAAEFYSLLGKATEAEGYFRRVLQIEPNHTEALMDLAALEKAVGQTAAAEETYRRLASLPDPKYRVAHAIFLFDSGRAADAIPELEQLRQHDSADRSVRSLLVTAYTAAGRTTEAERIVTEALKQNPKDVAAFFQRSLTRLRLGLMAQAQADLSQVLSMQPNSAQAHFLQAMIHQRSGSLRAEQQELIETLRLKPDLLPARLELARLLVHNGDGQAAVDLLDSALAVQKKAPALIAQRNWALFLVGDSAKLARGIEEGLSVSRTPELLVQDALLNVRGGRAEAAQKSIQEALKLDPGEVRALNLWVRLLSRRGDTMPALRAYAKEHANLAPVQQFYGELLLTVGNRAEARAAFQQAKASQPEFASADFSLAQMAIQDGKPDDARALLQPLLSGLVGMRAHLMMAAVEQMQGKIPEAIRHLEIVAAGESGNASALNDLAYLLVESGGGGEEALKYAQRAQELAPHDPNVQDTLGWVLYHRGMYTMALQYLQDSVAKQNAPLTNLHLAMTYAKAGDVRHGREFLEVAKRQNPGLPGLRAAEQLLGRAN